MFRFLFVPVALWIGLMPAHAEDKTADNADAKICKVERDIGSRIITRKVCMTRAQWEEQQRDFREDMRSKSKNRIWRG